MLKSLLRPLWYRRHRLVQNTKSLFGWTFSTLGYIPVPIYLKQAATDIAMLSVDHMIVHSQPYRNWHSQRAGTSRIQQLMQAQSAKTANTPDLPVAPDKSQWDALLESAVSYDEATLDVIIPVYRGYDQTLNAIYTALTTRACNSTEYNVIVINDASPEPDLTLLLETLAQQDLFEYHKNTQNLGFVQTVNKAMKLHTDRDVILLNSDTEVYHNWVDRLVMAAHKTAHVSTVTPLSNNAEICSYPYFVQDNDMTLEVSHAELDTLAAQVNAKATVEIPTGVGFCMYIARDCLNDIGYFDEETFGKGYGEENDFCRRAVAKGWKHLLACDTYVRHIGGTSFAASKKKLIERNYDKLTARHPDYTKIVHAFINADPVRPYRYALDMARLAKKMHAYTIMMVNHQMGGGTGRHVRELCEALHAEHISTLLLEPVHNGSGMVALKHNDMQHLPNLIFSMEYDRTLLSDSLRALHVRHMHMHHWVNFPKRITLFLQQLLRAHNWQYDVTLHDYYTVCPRINLVNHTERYCGEPDISGCERCIEVSPSHAHGAAVWEWRLHYGDILTDARRIFVPSEDMAQRMATYFPQLPFVVRPHAETFDEPSLATPLKQGETLRIAVIGAISNIKGSQILVDAVKDANTRDLPLEFILIGHSDHAAINAGMKRLTVTGQYEESEIAELLEAHRPHLVFIPSIWPETYCYTLSIAWRFGLMPVVFDIGAQAGRIREAGPKAGEILPYTYSMDKAALNNWFVSYSAAVDTVVKPQAQHYASYAKEYYDLDMGKPSKAAA